MRSPLEDISSWTLSQVLSGSNSVEFYTQNMLINLIEREPAKAYAKLEQIMETMARLNQDIDRLKKQMDVMMEHYIQEQSPSVSLYEKVCVA